MKHSLYIILTACMVAGCEAAEDFDRFWDSPSSLDYAEAAQNKDFTAILTVKKSPSDSVYFQLNDSTTIYPENYQHEFKRMERVICYINVWNEATGSYTYTCNVDWLESIEEGTVASGASQSGTDAIDVIEDWMTSVEDGYLTVHYDVWWGMVPAAHGFSVVTGTNPEDPYELLLKHDARGDAKDQKADGLVCFDINSLPSTEGKYKILTLKWTNLGGTASEKTFRFKTRE